MAEPAMTILEVLKTLPHRYPFLLVDRVLELEPGKRIVAIKNVTMNEPQFTGHWPENPVMPGVLMLEAIAQVGGIMVLCTDEDRGKIPIFAGVDGVRWRRLVRPGDQLVIEASMERRRGDMGRAVASAKVDGEIVCEGTFTFVLTPRDDVETQ